MNVQWQTSRQIDIKHPNRWGHSSATLPNNSLVFYGGYADSKFLKDVWVFNPIKSTWSQVKFNESAVKPVQRSNCSFIYCHYHKGIIMFGGGSHQNARLNDLWCLEISEKKESNSFQGNWKELFPKNGKMPWGRTYHVSQIFGCFLLIHGGQSYAGEIDDFWALNLQSLCWIELKSEEKNQARKFHSSAIVKQKFYVIGGIHGSYQTINKIQFVDLRILKSEIFQAIEDSRFHWKEVDLSGPLKNIIGRWGHISKVYENNIYIFGGRTSVEQNDLLIFHPKNNSLQKVSAQKLPQGRRKPCAWIVGSILVINSGYNGTYLSDQHWIDLRFTREDPMIQKLTISQTFCRKQLCDIHINTSDNKYIDMYSKFIRNSFQSEEDMIAMIEQLAEMNHEMASKYVEILNSGVYLSKNWTEQDNEELIFSDKNIPDENNLECIDEKKLKKYKITFSSNQLLANKKKILFNVVKENSVMNLNPLKLIRVTQQEFSRVLKEIQNDYCCDMIIVFQPAKNEIVSQQTNKIIKCCRYPLIFRSEYFMNVIHGIQKKVNAKRSQEIQIQMKQNDVEYELFKAVVLYCYYGHVIIPKEFTLVQCIALFKLAKRFSLETMMEICFWEIKQMIFSNDFDKRINDRLNRNQKSEVEKKFNPEKTLQAVHTTHENFGSNPKSIIQDQQFEELIAFCVSESKIEKKKLKKSSTIKKWEEILLYLTNRFAELAFKKHIAKAQKAHLEEQKLFKKEGKVKSSLIKSISSNKENINTQNEIHSNCPQIISKKKLQILQKKLFQPKEQKNGYFNMIVRLVRQNLIDTFEVSQKVNKNKVQKKFEQTLENKKKSFEENSIEKFFQYAIFNEKNSNEFKFRILQSELYRE